MLKTIDWQLIGFVAFTTFHDYWISIRLPEFYFWEAGGGNPPKNKAA